MESASGLVLALGAVSAEGSVLLGLVVAERLALGVHLVATCIQLTYRCVFVVYVVCVVFMGCVCV